jgi:hypothetical protein
MAGHLRFETVGETLRITGGTFSVREELKAAGGRWDPVSKAWVVKKDADITAVVTKKEAEMKALDEAARAPRPKPVRGYTGPCCAQAKSFTLYEFGPLCFRCDKHGETHNSYTGD